MKRVSKNSKRAEPIRKVISATLINALSDKNGEIPLSTRQKLATFLDQSISQADKVIYYGEGSFDALVSAIQFALKIKPSETKDLVGKLLIGLKKENPVDEGDKIWFDLPLSKNKRIYYASLIKEAERLSDKLLLDD